MNTSTSLAPGFSVRNARFGAVCLLAVCASALGCGSDPEATAPTTTASAALEGDIGPAGGTLVGAAGTPFSGVRLQIPAGALSAMRHVRIVEAIDDTPLPELAVRIGPQFQIEPAGESLAQPARWTLPVAREFRGSLREQPREIKVWLRAGDGWTLSEPSGTTESSADIDVTSFTLGAAGVRANLMIPPRGCAATGTCVNLTTCTPAGGLCVGVENTLNFNTFGAGAISVMMPRAHTIPNGEAFTFLATTSSTNPLVTVFTAGRVFLPANTASFGTQALGTGPLGPLTEAGFLLGTPAIREVSGDTNTLIAGRLSAAPVGATTLTTSIQGPAPTLFNQASFGSVQLRDGRTVIFRRANGGNNFAALIDSMVVRQSTGQLGTAIALTGGARQLLGAVADPSSMDGFWLVTTTFGATPAPPISIQRFNSQGQVTTTATLPANLAARFAVQDCGGGSGGGGCFFTNFTFGVAATAQGVFLAPPDVSGTTAAPSTPPFVRVALDGAASNVGTAAVDNLTFGAHLELIADPNGNLWTRSFLSNGLTAVVFHGQGGAGPSQILQLNANPFIQNIFPSATSGIFALIRPSTGTPRPLKFVQIRPNGM